MTSHGFFDCAYGTPKFICEGRDNHPITPPPWTSMIVGKFAGTTNTNGGNTGRKDCIYSINIKLNNATSVLITDRTINILFITSESNRQEKINVICEEDNRRKIIFILSSYHSYPRLPTF